MRPAAIPAMDSHNKDSGEADKDLGRQFSFDLCINYNELL